MAGVFVLSLLGFIGTMFLSLLLGYAYPAGKRGERQAKPFIFAALFFLVCMVYVGIKGLNEPLFEYTIRVHYVDGYSQLIKYKSIESTPRIQMSTGGYYLRYNGEIEYGVIRYEIVSKKRIKN